MSTQKKSNNSKTIGTGDILISNPLLNDAYLDQSVIMIVQHNDKEGSVGFCLNKITNMAINEVLQDFPKFDAPVFFGGGVRTDVIHFVHTFPLEDSIEVFPGCYWGGNLNKLTLMIETKQVSPHEIRFFAGYCGWEARDLRKEIANKDWFTDKCKSHYVFNTKPDLWSKVLSMRGGNFRVLSNILEAPSLN